MLNKIIITMKKTEKYNLKKMFIITFLTITSLSCGGVDTDNLLPLFPTEEVEEVDNGDLAGSLEVILGDVKQAQILNSLSTTLQIENLLDGFEELGVQGIRITIFPEGENPNEEMFNYLYTRAKAEGFKIMANPALWEGAQRIANKVLHGTIVDPNNQGAAGPSVLGNDQASQIVIDRIKEFANTYEVDWITPFNEDGRPGVGWSINQINEIYSELHNNINGAELIGPCTWGIPAGTLMLEQTDIKQYITAATTHNLGFNHTDWPGFIDAAGDLPVWDSEVNNNAAFVDRATRIDAAISAGVNGLVLYDSWRTISLTDGSLKVAGNTLKAKIYK